MPNNKNRGNHPKATDADTPVTMDAIRDLLRSELALALEPLKQEISRLNSENQQIRSILAQQQLTIEKAEIQRRATNIIINGLDLPDKDSPNDMETTKVLLDKVREPDGPNFSILQTKRIGKVTGRSQLLLVTLENCNDRQKILRNAKGLKNKPGFEKIYINADLPVLTRKENSRLYAAAKQLRNLHPSKSVVLKFGKLTLDDVEVDRFDLENQLFLDEN